MARQDNVGKSNPLINESDDLKEQIEDFLQNE